MKKTIIIALAALLVLASCGSTASVDAGATAQAGTAAEKSSSKKESAADKNLYKGAGLVIAVTAPEVRNGGKAEAWMPQFFQDSITGNLAKYSKMTVLDRANENLTKAEQELSESGWYTEEDAVQLGQMTNAQYAVFGSITTLASSYELNFRAIDITTNEIRAAYNDRATATDIENGNAVREVTQHLLEGLGIQLSDKEKQQLAKTDAKSVNATKSLAKGAAAEKADNLIEALAFYTEAQQNGATKKEASAGINSILGTGGTVSGNAIANLKAQAAWENEQVEKWNKIFAELAEYVRKNAFILVYDFSKVEAKMNPYGAVELTATGAKIIPVRNVLLLVNRVYAEWVKVRDAAKNATWVERVKMDGYKRRWWSVVIPNIIAYHRNPGGTSSNIVSESYRFIVGVYDESGYCRKQGQCYPLAASGADIDNIKPQKRYFDDKKYSEFHATLKLEELPDDSDLILKPIKLEIVNGDAGYKIPFMSIDEYNEWAKNQ